MESHLVPGHNPGQARDKFARRSMVPVQIRTHIQQHRTTPGQTRDKSRTDKWKSIWCRDKIQDRPGTRTYGTKAGLIGTGQILIGTNFHQDKCKATRFQDTRGTFSPGQM